MELIPYHCEHDAILHTFYLPEDQQQFTGMPDEMLALAKQDPHCHPVVISVTAPIYISEYFPHVREVVLGVNARNLPAQSLYLKCGFKDEGDTKMGSHGLQHILKMSLHS
ncbi:hypothetical protein C1I60_11750 [Paenibacillus terrae]|uniref:N-acetyltransferase domain-containing protein n=1 Tax=Paenibacillus terrae TaxID=159743 RepID=A0A4U2PZ07_9BACL|nr:hypothetical protein [Paenibacillus terrae]TKH44019.1 hypothetical protein C1I60_11750 [Paenibacillus terrae]